MGAFLGDVLVSRKKVIGCIAVLILMAFATNYVIGEITGHHYLPQMFQIGQGFTTLSFSQISLASYDPDIAGKVWLMFVAQSGLGQHAFGEVNAETLQDDGSLSRKGFTLDLTNSEQRCVYPIAHDPGAHMVNYMDSEQYECGFWSCPTTEHVMEDCGKYGTPYMDNMEHAEGGRYKWWVN